jgi:hypothetical protein
MTPPQQIGQYRLEERLDGGQRADVYRAVDVIRKRTVTLRLLHVEHPEDEAKVRRVLQQVQHAAELVHPHIAWVWETGEAHGQFYVAERYANGPTLAGLLAEKGPFSWEAARLAITQAAEALDFAHGRGWVHGWLSPAQILSSAELGAVVTGFGWPQPVIPDSEVAGSQPGAIPWPAELPGNGAYLAPEIWLGQPARPGADQYALACIWVELLTGRPLFDAASWEEVRDLHFMPPALPRAWPEGTPWQIEAALARALAGEPGDRYPDLAALLAAPAEMAAQGQQSAEGRARRSAELRAWQEEQAHNRRQSEEAARLAALEQARREVEEQILQAQQIQLPPEEEAFAEALPPLPGTITPARRRPHRRPAKANGRRWGLWAGLTVVLLALGGFWLVRSAGSGSLWPATPTTTATLESALPTAGVHAPATATVLAATATRAATASFTPSITPSPTATPTRTPTRSPTITLTHTPGPIATRTPSRTPTPRNPNGPSDRP